MVNRDGSTVLRTSLLAALIGLGLVGAVMEVQADLSPRETRGAAHRLQFDMLWTAHVATVDQALARHDISAAVGAWHDAYGAALASRGWEGMIVVGDAFLRIGVEAGSPRGSRPNARQAYLNALVRAHRDGSTDGMRRTAEAFAALGDQAVAEHCFRVADELAAARGRSSTTTGKLALIAHDHKKVDLVAWATFNRETLAAFPLVATRHTARLVRGKVGLEVEKLLSGPESGDAQIAAGVATGQIDELGRFLSR